MTQQHSYSSPLSSRPLFSRALVTSMLIAALALPGCSLFSVYKIDLPQGTPITQSQAAQVQVGMTQAQVLYLLGSPALRDTLAPNRWDYIYDFQAGTEGRRAGKADITNASQHLIIYFNAAGQVSRIEGVESLPTSSTL